MADEKEKLKYLCHVKSCREDLTEQVEDKTPTPVFHLLDTGPKAPKSHRIYAICSKGHFTVFTVFV